MRVLLVSGIWPPDVGGPASHVPELAAYLLRRGHAVEVVTTASAAPPVAAHPVHWVSRSLPPGARHAATVRAVTRRARSADVVYGMSMIGRIALGARAARRPLVLKLVADDAYERARRWGLYGGDIDAFQRHGGGMRIRALRAARGLALRRVDHLVCPSAYLADLAVSWGVPPGRVTVLPNPAPPVPALEGRAELRRRLDVDGPVLAFAGRVTRQKALEVALGAVGGVDGVTLLLAGDGPDLARVRDVARGLGDRVRFLGPLDRRGVLEVFRAADAALLSSAWENFPHTVVEALAVGTPVLATAAGGVAEIVRDGENGLLVPVGDVTALETAIRRFFGDEELRGRLRAGAAPSVEHLSADVVYGRLERILQDVAR